MWRNVPQEGFSNRRRPANIKNLIFISGFSSGVSVFLFCKNYFWLSGMAFLVVRQWWHFYQIIPILYENKKKWKIVNSERWDLMWFSPVLFFAAASIFRDLSKWFWWNLSKERDILMEFCDLSCRFFVCCFCVIFFLFHTGAFPYHWKSPGLNSRYFPKHWENRWIIIFWYLQIIILIFCFPPYKKDIIYSLAFLENSYTKKS